MAKAKEPTHKDRRKRAEFLLLRAREMGWIDGQGLHEDIQDTVADILHALGRNQGETAQELVNMAVIHYEAEAGDGD